MHNSAIRRDSLIRLFAVLGLVTLTLVIIIKVENMLVSFLIAFVIFYLLSPLVSALERLGISRALSTTLLYAAIITVLSVTLSIVVPLISAQIGALKVELPGYIDGMSRLFSSTEARVNSYLNSIYTLDMSQELRATMFSWASGLFEGLPKVAQKFFTVIILAPFFAFFMILDGRQASRSLLGLVPNNLFELGLNLMHQLSHQIGHFIRARLLEAVIVGLVVWIGLELMDFRFASLLALFAAITNLIPYVGPLIGAVPALCIAFLNGSTSIDIFFLLLVYGIAQLIDMVFIIPLVVAKIVDLHPVTVVVVIIIGSQVLGVVGMIISIPVASALKLIVTSVLSHVLDFRR